MKDCQKPKVVTCSLYKKIACFFFTVIMVFVTVIMNSNFSLAAAKESKSRAIAIVFDNSGTMYKETAWCRATYAMEVFASMANDQDQISIYPMNDIEVNGTTYTSTFPLTLEDVGDASMIRQIFTPKSGDTPIETITDAYNGLSKMSADEKWLVVLTDGDQFYENGVEMSMKDTEKRLSEILSDYNNSVNLMYLGIGSEATKPEVSGSMFHDVVIAADSKDILKDLTDMCNNIYGRDEMRIDSDSVVFDLSMTKLVLFVQGSNISDLKLVDETGNEIGTPISTCSPNYPEAPGSGSVEGNNYYKDNAADTTLSGQMTTYENVPAGDYKLQYSGSSSNVAVYYEPNVNVSAFLMDEDGTNVMDLNAGEIYPGTYSLVYGLVDENGNFTVSKLLGDREFTITYSVNGEEKTETRDDNGSIPIDLKEGDVVEAQVVATYLDGYHVSTKSSADWPFPITISDTPVYELSAEIEADSSYSISQLQDGEADPIVVNVTYDGEKLTAEEMANVKLSLGFGELESTDWVETDSENSRFLIYPKVGASETGTYTATVDVTYTNEYGKKIAAPSISKEIEFNSSSIWFRWVIIGVLLLIILVIGMIIMNQKVLPKRIKIQDAEFRVGRTRVAGDPELRYHGGKKKATLEVTSPTDANGISCTMKLQLCAVDPRRENSKYRRVKVMSVQPSDYITTEDIDGFTLRKDKGGVFRRTDIVDDQNSADGSLNIELKSEWNISMKGVVRKRRTEKNVSFNVKFEQY